jgi:periplasmic protein TonB
MNLFKNNSSKLNDVIFENRNKNYGAYLIRRSYHESIFKALFYLCTCILIVFGSAYFVNRLTQKELIKTALVFDDPKIILEEYVSTIDVTPIENKSTEAVSKSSSPAGGISTIIKDQAVVTSSITSLNPLNGTDLSGTPNELLNGTDKETSLPDYQVADVPKKIIETVVVAEEMPEFEGGFSGLMKYIGSNIVYPELAKEINQEGTVYISFIVNETGLVEQVKVMKGIGFGCDEEVVRVITKMPRWKKAGKNGGHPVKVRFNMPVAFKLK